MASRVSSWDGFWLAIWLWFNILRGELGLAIAIALFDRGCSKTTSYDVLLVAIWYWFIILAGLMDLVVYSGEELSGSE